MKRLENLNSLRKEQVLSLQANRGSCIVSNLMDMPTFEFAVCENEGVTMMGIDDSKQLHIIPLYEAKKLEGYLSATLDIPVSGNAKGERELEYIATIDMNFKEKEVWENENCASAIGGDNGEVLEFKKSHYYSTDENGNKVLGSETSTLAIAACDDMGEDEIYITVSSKDEVRKLRDYLNNYLENNF